MNGNPKLADPTRSQWFDTSKFSIQDSFTPRSNPWYFDGLDGPSTFMADMTLSKVFRLGLTYRLEARFEAYNAFNTIVWDNPDLNLANITTFGKVRGSGWRGRPRDSARRTVPVLVECPCVGRVPRKWNEITRRRAGPAKRTRLASRLSLHPS